MRKSNWIILIKATIIGMVGGIYVCAKALRSDHGNMLSKLRRADDYYHVLVQWMRNKYNGNRLSNYFIKHGYSKVAIYGMGEIGDLLYEELLAEGFKVEYSIDQIGGSHIKELRGYTLKDELPEVDAIVITPIFAMDSICNSLQNKTNAKLVSLKEIIYDL